MTMSMKLKAAVAGVLVIAAVGASAQAASARATTPDQSSSPFYLLDDTATLRPESATIGWEDFTLGYPKGVDTLDETPFIGSADATAVTVFLSNRGSERDIQNWIGRAGGGFMPGTTNVLYPQITLNILSGLNIGSVKANGGSFSLGIAYTKQNGVQIADAGVQFVHIVVQPGGAWTYEATADAPPPPPGDSKDIDISAEVQEAPGSLTFSVPTTSVALTTAINATTQLSESTGSISGITVSDTRRTADRKGWDLTQTVADFVSGGNTIEKKNLGVKVTKVSGAAAAAASAEQVAGSATYPSPFATATAGVSTEPTTELKADLKLVAPAGTPAGTYTSKMTLTLVSK